MNEPDLRRSLTCLPIPDIRYYETTGSTNDVALQLVDDGARDGTLVVADEQTSGRGRLSRHWVTQAGAALAFSLVLRARPWEAERLGLLSPLGALAVSLALEKKYNLSPCIKWPNDVLLAGRKMCGILLEASWSGERLQAVVVGIGVNVLKESVPPPETLLYPATSLEDVLGRAVDRVELLRAILDHLFAWRERITTVQFLQEWESRLAFMNQWVRVEHGGQQAISGQMVGVVPSGELRLRLADDEEVLVSAGDVRLRPVEDAS